MAEWQYAFSIVFTAGQISMFVIVNCVWVLQATCWLMDKTFSKRHCFPLVGEIDPTPALRWGRGSTWFTAGFPPKMTTLGDSWKFQWIAPGPFHGRGKKHWVPINESAEVHEWVLVQLSVSLCSFRRSFSRTRRPTLLSRTQKLSNNVSGVMRVDTCDVPTVTAEEPVSVFHVMGEVCVCSRAYKLVCPHICVCVVPFVFQSSFQLVQYFLLTWLSITLTTSTGVNSLFRNAWKWNTIPSKELISLGMHITQSFGDAPISHRPSVETDQRRLSLNFWLTSRFGILIHLPSLVSFEWFKITCIGVISVV